LLEFLFEALWKMRQGTRLQYDAYHRLRRGGGAIAHRADEVFERELRLFISSARGREASAQEKPQRQAWVAALQSGHDPFDPETLKALRYR
jgi:hypothetical protein